MIWSGVRIQPPPRVEIGLGSDQGANNPNLTVWNIHMLAFGSITLEWRVDDFHAL